MSTVVLISHNVPDKKLEKETIYKYHPSGEMAAKIISDLVENAKVDIHDGIFVDFDFNISVKNIISYTNQQIKINATKNL